MNVTSLRARAARLSFMRNKTSSPPSIHQSIPLVQSPSASEDSQNSSLVCQQPTDSNTKQNTQGAAGTAGQVEEATVGAAPASARPGKCAPWQARALASARPRREEQGTLLRGERRLKVWGAWLHNAEWKAHIQAVK